MMTWISVTIPLIAASGMVARNTTRKREINRRKNRGLSGSIGVFHPLAVRHLESSSVFQEAPMIRP